MFTRLRKLLIPVILIILSNITGCGGYKPPVYDAGKVRNPTVGYNGYSLKIPDSLQIVDEKVLAAYRRVFTRRLVGGDNEIQYTDFFVFKTDDGEITIYFGVVGVDFFGGFSLLYDDEKESLLTSKLLGH